MNEQITIKELFSLDKTIGAGIFEGEEVISLTTEDTVNARVQLPDGSYELQDRRGRPVLNCQTELAARARRALQQKEKDINEGLI